MNHEELDEELRQKSQIITDEIIKETLSNNSILNNMNSSYPMGEFDAIQQQMLMQYRGNYPFNYMYGPLKK